MAELRVTLNVEIDGEALPDMPIIRRYILNETAQLNFSANPDNNTTSFHAIPAAIMPSMGIFFLTFDQAANLNINQNTPLPLNANSVVLILGANLAQGTPSNNVTYNNPAASGGAVLNMSGLVAGT